MAKENPQKDKVIYVGGTMDGWIRKELERILKKHHVNSALVGADLMSFCKQLKWDDELSFYIGKVVERMGKDDHVFITYSANREYIVKQVIDKMYYLGLFEDKRERSVFTKEGDDYKCSGCRYIYSRKEEKSFSDLPNSWKCPACSAPKRGFRRRKIELFKVKLEKSEWLKGLQ